MKQCAKCKQILPLTSFYTSNKDKSGFKSYCKKCHTSASEASPNRQQVASTYYHRRKLANPQIFMWKQAKHRAKWDYDNMEFTILVEDIIIPEVCPYLNVPFVPLDKELSPSLDRIDSSKGYTPDNIRVISYKANRMKSNATEQELISFAKGVLKVHQGGLGRVNSM